MQQIIIRSQIRLDSATFTPTFSSEHDSVNVSISARLLAFYADNSAQYGLKLSGYVPLFHNPELGNHIPNISIPIEVTHHLTRSDQVAALRNAQSRAVNPEGPPTLSPSSMPNQSSGPSDEHRRARRGELEEQMRRIQAELDMLGAAPEAQDLVSSRSAPYDAWECVPIPLDTEDFPPPSYADAFDQGA